MQLNSLCFVRAAFEAGISLDALARLYRALDAADGDEAAAQLAVLRQYVEHFCGLECYRRFQARAKTGNETDADPNACGSLSSD